MKNKLVLAILLSALTVSFLSAQSTEVYAPFVSRLKAAVRGPQIKLTWKDSPDIKGNYLIYRHTQDITHETFRDAVLIGRVEAGSESFIDAPPERGEFFYAVVAETSEGKVFNVFIPFRNKTMKGIAIESTAEEKDLAAVITGITARVEQDRVTVTFKSSRADRDLILYRSTSPILSGEQLSLANTAATLRSSESGVTDFPVPGIPYYYAVVDAKLLEAGTAVLVAGESASVSYAEIPLKADKQPEAFPRPDVVLGRPIPLPYFLLSTDISRGRDLEAKSVMGLPPSPRLAPETRKALIALLAKTPEPAYPDKKAQLLEVDKGPGTSKDEYTLKTILDGAFEKRDWKEMEKLLTNFMSIHLSDEMRIRAHFYRGQALFFQEKYPESFMEFLLAQDTHYPEVRPWLDEILRLRRLTGSPSEG